MASLINESSNRFKLHYINKVLYIPQKWPVINVKASFCA